MFQRINNVLISILLLALISCQPQDQIIKILVTTDVHGAIFPYDPITGKKLPGSMAQVSTYLNDARSENQSEVMALDNGDIIQGDPSVYYYNFEKTGTEHLFTKIMSLLKYDAATIGNHDIETGHPVYDRIAEELPFSWLAANCINTKTGDPYFSPYAIFRKGKIKIAVLGLITPKIPAWLPENIWSGMRFDDMIESAAYWLPLIKEKEKPDLIVGLFHSGLEYNYNHQNETTLKNENASLLVAQKVAGFDIIFAGHDHKTWNRFITDPDGDSVLILGSQSRAREIAEASIHLRKQNGEWVITHLIGKNIRLDTVEPDKAFINYFQNDIKAVKSYVNQDLGNLTTKLSTAEAFFGPSAFMTLIHQVQLDVSGANISFAAPLSFNTTIEPGIIKMNDLFDLYRFENLLYTMELSGKEILDYLNYSYGLWFNSMSSPDDHLIKMEKDKRGRFRTISAYYNFDSAQGIDYIVDVTQPTGKMVTITKLSNGDAFDIKKTYRVAINSYRGNGGGGHLLQGSGLSEEELSNRLIKSTDKDLRFYMKGWIIDQGSVNIKKVENWKVIPAALANSGAEKDYKILFRN